MKSALILALAGSAIAVPSLSPFLDAIFGGSENDSNTPSPSDLPNLPALGTGSAGPVSFPVATGAPSFPGSNNNNNNNNNDYEDYAPPQARALHIDYRLAPGAPSPQKSSLKHRQQDHALPAFSLLDPNALPTGLPTGFPTGLPSGFPTDLPTGFPTDLPTGLPTNLPTDLPAGTGVPGFPPTTLKTMMRGPQPTSALGVPGLGQEGEEEEEQGGRSLLAWIDGLFGAGAGAGGSE